MTSVGAGRASAVETLVEVVPDAPPLTPVPPPRPADAERGAVHLDDISKAIVEQLQQDGRRSYAKIATAVGLSEAAVRQRVARLTDAIILAPAA